MCGNLAGLAGVVSAAMTEVRKVEAKVAVTAE